MKINCTTHISDTSTLIEYSDLSKKRLQNMKECKLLKWFQYDKKIWDGGEIQYTWQFVIIKNRALFLVFFETPGAITHSSGGVNVLFSFFGNSLMSVDFQQNKFGLTFGFLTKYFEGYEN